MTDKKCYERAMRQDFPKDFVSDDEWDYIESLASCKGDGVKNKSITVCRIPKSGGDKYMARQQQNNDQPVRTVQEKCAYYKKRINDPKLTDGQREFAQRRYNSLSGTNTVSSSNKTKYTDGEKAAYNAGIGYSCGKSGKRVPVRDENKDSFRAGLDRGRRL